MSDTNPEVSAELGVNNVTLWNGSNRGKKIVSSRVAIPRLIYLDAPRAVDWSDFKMSTVWHLKS